MSEKQVIDVCCGGKMFWFDKQNPIVEFCDKRSEQHILCDGRYFEVKPDTVCDFTNLPFSDGQFNLVVFDPPHLLRNTGRSKYATNGSLNDKESPTGYQHIKYGALYSDWKDMISKGFKECFRVVKKGGIVIFKWNETDIKVREILELTEEVPLFGHKSGKRSNTHWICFMKTDDKQK